MMSCSITCNVHIDTHRAKSYLIKMNGGATLSLWIRPQAFLWQISYNLLCKVHFLTYTSFANISGNYTKICALENCKSSINLVMSAGMKETSSSGSVIF